MMSCKGFLSPDPNRRPRMTAKHKAAVLKAVAAGFDHWIDKTELGGMAEPLAKSSQAIVEAAFDAYPTDRSCRTCDFLAGTTCQHWNQEVPADAIEAGCDKHKEQGTPF